MRSYFRSNMQIWSRQTIYDAMETDMKSKFRKFALGMIVAGTVALSPTMALAGDNPICDMEATSLNMYFYQILFC